MAGLCKTKASYLSGGIMNFGSAAAQTPMQKQKVTGMFPRKKKSQPPQQDAQATHPVPLSKGKKHWTEAASRKRMSPRKG